MDQVHDMMDDIAEQQDVAREISDAISNPVAFGHDIDEVSRSCVRLFYGMFVPTEGCVKYSA